MRHSSSRYKKINDVAIVVFGGVFILGSLACLAMSFMERAKHDRWQDAPQLHELGELRTIGLGNDVTLAGFIAPDTPVSSQGLALYETWERETHYSGSRKRETWTQIYAHKPDFELLFVDQRVVIQSTRAIFQKTREIQLNSKTELKGFAPGDEVTIMGTVASTDGAQVQADILCGGSRAQCLGQISTGATIALVVAAISVLVGIGLAVLGIRRLRT
jgi:hypothetical protein